MPETQAEEIRLGLIGSAIQGSRSPEMHMEEARACHFSLRYQLFDLAVMPEGEAALPRLLDEAETAGFAGVNVTHPCKQRVIAYLHELSSDARVLRAVNTVVFQRGRRVGYNTDWSGFARSLRQGMPKVLLGQVTQLGAGGAGAAVAYALLQLGTRKLCVYDIDVERANDLVNALGAQFGSEKLEVAGDLSTAVAGSDGLVNATPMGMAKYPGLPLPAALLRPGLWVADIVYFPIETELLRLARSRGCCTLDGGGMAVFQAADAFRLFTGVDPDVPRMMHRFRSAIATGSDV